MVNMPIQWKGLLFDSAGLIVSDVLVAPAILTYGGREAIHDNDFELQFDISDVYPFYSQYIEQQQILGISGFIDIHDDFIPVPFGLLKAQYIIRTKGLTPADIHSYFILPGKHNLLNFTYNHISRYVNFTLEEEYEPVLEGVMTVKTFMELVLFFSCLWHKLETRVFSIENDNMIIHWRKQDTHISMKVFADVPQLYIVDVAKQSVKYLANHHTWGIFTHMLFDND